MWPTAADQTAGREHVAERCATPRRVEATGFSISAWMPASASRVPISTWYIGGRGDHGVVDAEGDQVVELADDRVTVEDLGKVSRRVRRCRRTPRPRDDRSTRAWLRPITPTPTSPARRRHQAPAPSTAR